MHVKIIILLVISVLLQACAGSRASYESLIQTKNDTTAIYLSLGETKEILAVSNGFPGWWGFYPGVSSISPQIASIACKEERSLIPFRSPGVIFGGEVCYITANSLGETWVFPDNKMSRGMSGQVPQENKIKIVVTKP